jgi:Xaa-Pro aminopeptidase
MSRPRLLSLVLAAVLPLALLPVVEAAGSQEPALVRDVVERSHPLASPLGPSFHAGRRKALAEALGKEGVFAMRGAEDTRNYLEFRQSNDFWYLTGVETPGAALLLDAKTAKSVLFLPREAGRASIEGADLHPGEEAQRITGIEETRPIEEFADAIEALRGKGPVFTPFAPEEIHQTSRDRAQGFEGARARDPFDGRPSREKAFADALAKKLGKPARDASPHLDELRRVKTPEEVEAMREASRVGAEGMREAMRACRPGRFEWEIAATAHGAFLRLGARGPAYFAIVGSGPNSIVLHYYRKNRRIEEGEVVLVDFGPEVHYYTTDISRTFPASGKFTERQREVYEACLAAQEATLAAIRPGVTIAELTRIASEAIREADLGKYIRHGPCHYIGMAVHDVGEYGKPLEPGVCFTVEPGIYVPEEDLGVRIEDTVVVTEKGHENLSALAPRTVEEIEAWMRGAGARVIGR